MKNRRYDPQAGGDFSVNAVIRINGCLALGLLFLSLFAVGCDLRREALISGETMGTTYHIKVVVPFFSSAGGLKKQIEKRLGEINRSMSTYMADSEISRFNALTSAGARMAVSSDFLQVMRVAQNLYDLTGGAWDGTVNPLVNLWGFGASGSPKRIPAAADIQTAMSAVGFEHIDISTKGYLIKKMAAVSLDLGSIAKGYGVDQLSELLRANGLNQHLVEIGGEVYASGVRKDGKPWNVGINLPRKDAAFDSVYKVVSLRDQALATSGDYRNFFEYDNRRYSHILDPRTGYPVTNTVVSVSIISDACTFADGLATAVMVLGPAKGLELLNHLDRVEGLIVVRGKDGALINYYSKGLTADD